MSAAVSVRCPHCEGNPAKYADRCPRCGDAGRVELPADPVEDAPRPKIATRIARDAAVDVQRALVGSPIDTARREFVAPNVALMLHAGTRVDRVVAYLRGEGLTEEHAFNVVLAYVRSVEDFARRRPRRVDTAKDMERERQCRACDEHVAAIKAELPARLRAVA